MLASSSRYFQLVSRPNDREVALSCLEQACASQTASRTYFIAPTEFWPTNIHDEEGRVCGTDLVCLAHPLSSWGFVSGRTKRQDGETLTGQTRIELRHNDPFTQLCEILMQHGRMKGHEIRMPNPTLLAPIPNETKIRPPYATDGHNVFVAYATTSEKAERFGENLTIFATNERTVKQTFTINRGNTLALLHF